MPCMLLCIDAVELVWQYSKAELPQVGILLLTKFPGKEIECCLAAVIQLYKESKTYLRKVLDNQQDKNEKKCRNVHWRVFKV